MPRIKYPPTPATSTGPPAQDKQSEMEGTFALPPAAMNRSPPTSPVIQRKRTLSGGARTKEDLPPPPSRARKIIQMKPKEDLAAPSASTTTAKTSTTSPKRKQPSATSAAGRKIARKTAHSIIERRRRSKMNEEFGVLKDMIPACKGVEMHKLAILQAGIEYVKYLQGCVEKLQNERGSELSWQRPAIVARPAEEEEEDDDEDEDMEENPVAARKTPSASPVLEKTASYNFKHRRASITTDSTATTTTSAQASPALRPNDSSSSLAGQRQLPPLVSKTYSTSPPPLSAQTPLQTGVSPAFNAIHFNPDLNLGRTFSHTQSNQGLGHSPSILPLPKAAMPVGFAGLGQQAQTQNKGGEGQAEATATAALMMLTNDRRGNGGSGRSGGMSVQDLLSH